MRRLECFLEATTRLICRVPLVVVFLSLTMAAAGLWLTATQLGYVSNTMDLIREDAVFRKIYARYVEEFNIRPDLVVVTEGEPSLQRQALDWVGQKLSGDPLFESVDWRLDFSALRKKSLWLAPANDLEAAAEGLRELENTLQGRALRWDEILQSTAVSFEQNSDADLEQWRRSRNNFLEFIKKLESWENLLVGKENLENKDYPFPNERGIGLSGFSYEDIFSAEREWERRSRFEFDDGRLGILLLRPVNGDPSAFSPDAPAISRVRQVLSEAKQIFPGVGFGLTGEPVLDADQVEASIVSVAWASGIALTLIVSLFLMSYREATRPVLAVITLIVGTLWTFGAATLLVGHLNIISNAFVAMVLGLGIDFGIQLIGRYEEEISRGKKAIEALCCSVSCTGSAIIVGALTTTAAFFSMCFNDFTGLAELGIIAGLGVILCLTANFTLLPALIWLADRHRKNLQETALASHWRGGFLLREPGRKNPNIVIVCAVVLSALTAIIAVVFRAGNFDYNLLNLQNPNLESVRVEKKLIEKGQQSINYAVAVAENLDEARKLASQFGQLPTVQGVGSAADLIPCDQENKIAQIQNLVKLAAEICSRREVDWNMRSVTQSLEKLFSASKDAIEEAEAFSSISEDARDAYELLARLREVLQKIITSAQQLSEEEFLARTVKWDSENIGPVRSALQWIGTQDTSQITQEDIPPFLRKRWISPNGKFAVEIYPKENVWEREAAEAFVSEIRTIAPDVTGTPVMNLEYLFMLREAFVRAGLLAVAVILVVMLMHFRSVRLTILALVPLVLAIIWTLGLMPFFGLKFNPANIITLPLTVGIGVAYGIYVVDRLREVRGGDLFDTSTGKSVWLSALTTIIGFGSLIQASYRGISSLGLLMTLSVGMCLIASLYVLPTLTRRFLNYAEEPKQTS